MAQRMNRAGVMAPMAHSAKLTLGLKMDWGPTHDGRMSAIPTGMEGEERTPVNL